MSIHAKTTTDKLTEPFPPQAIKTRQGGGSKRLSYVEGHTVIHRLIAATGNQFDLRVLSVDQKGDLMTALVELTIPGLGSRQHMGVQKIAPNAGEDLVKGAITDAMKKAATLFGVGLELYGPDYGGDEDAAPPQDTSPRAPARTTPQPSPISRPAAAPTVAAGQPLTDQNSQRATERQVKFIWAIAQEAGLDGFELEEWSMELYGGNVDSLNRRDASTLIEALQRRRNEVA